MFDANGYPTEHSLDLIKNWDITKNDIFEFLKKLWKFRDGYWTEIKHYNDVNELVLHEYQLSTAGWSGNEDIIQAFQNNFIAWSM